MDIVKEHEALIKLDRGSGAVTALADEYCSRGLWAEAVRVCRRNPAFHPEQLRGRVLLGWALKELGEWDEAERVLGEAAMEVQRNALLFSLLAEMAEREGNIKRAELFLDICQNLRAAALEQATAWILMGKPDLGMTINGCLAGLVAITAPCAWVSQPASIVIGAISGVLVVFAVLFFDKMKWDDPVGALAVHLCNGIFGTLAVGLWGSDKFVALPAGATKGLFNGGGVHQLVTQLTGSVSVILFTLALSLIFWAVIKATMGMRVSRDEEINGLDIGEHGMEAYAGFQITAAEYTLMPAGGNGSTEKPKEKELAKAGR